MKYLRIARRVFDTPLLLSEQRAEIIRGVMLRRMRMEAGDEESEEPEEKPQNELVGNIAVISITGELVQRTSGMDAMSGLRSYLSIAADVEAAVHDPQVKGILLRVDSPGGEVAGAWDAADAILAARQRKPVWALAEDNALSAGYLLASQADRLLMSQTALAGSIGIVMMHFDQSKADKDDGIVITTLYRGRHKADFSPHAPLSDEARAWAEAHLDRRYEQFIAAVVRGRPQLSDRDVRRTEAALIDAPDAVAGGFADAIVSYRDLIPEFSAAVLPAPARTPIARASAIATSRTKEGTSVSDVNVQADAAPAPDLMKIRAEARRQALEEAAEIAAFCDVAGNPRLTADCLRQLAEGKTKLQIMDDVRKRRTDSAAAADEPIHSAITAEDGARVSAADRYRPGTEKPAQSLADLQRQRYADKGRR